MGVIKKPLPVKLFIGVLSSIPDIFADVEARLSGLFGPVDLRSDLFPFDSTHYYDEEMGTPIHRRFCSFADLITATRLARIKLQTNALEADLATGERRVARPGNLDPGYLEESKIILASTKNFYHRIPISDEIYAEVTMHYRKGVWMSLPWTFPDFRSGRYRTFFDEMRRIYRGQLESMR